MSQALPPDLVHPSIPVLREASENDVDFTSAEELHRFWKVYDAQKDYVDDPSILRLRNLFWRIWSSDRLAKSISNEQLNQFWLRCGRQRPLKPFRIPSSFARRYNLDPDTAVSTRRRSSHEFPLTKKAPITQVYTPGAAEASFSKIAEDTSKSTETREIGNAESSSTSTGSRESAGRPAVRRTVSGSRSRPPMASGASRGRIRPALPRRKSSQSRTHQNDASRAAPSALRSPTSLQLPPSSQEGSSRPSNLQARAPAFTLPPSSWQSVDESSENNPSPNIGSSLDRGESLVDRNFRSKFLSSATNLPALGRMRKTGSVVRFADEEEDIGRGKGKEAARPENPEKLRSRGRASSEVIESDDSDEVRLPRTTSQLSMAIKDRRKKSGSQDLGPEPTADAAPRKKSEAKKKEEEILDMGRRAAAPQIPKGLPGSDYDVGYRPPSPGPTF